MVDRHLTDGRRIAQLLAAEVRGRTDGPLGPLSVVDVRDVAGGGEGAFAFAIERADGESVADVYVHAERVRLAIHAPPDAAADAARQAGVDVRGPATEPPRTVVSVGSGADVKRACDVLRAVA